MNMHDPNVPTTTTAMAMASGMSMGGHGHGGMDSEMAPMNSYLTRKYSNYPVLFEKLYAGDKAEAFGIFLLIVVASFAYKLLLFISWYLELKWFKKPENDAAGHENEMYTVEDLELQKQFLPTSFGRFMFNVFAPAWPDFIHDVIRLLITFCATLLIYMLMLVAMTFVLTYVFAVIVGLSLGEIFFNRIKLNMLQLWEKKKEWEKRFQQCQCGPASGAVTAAAVAAHEPEDSFDGSDSGKSASYFHSHEKEAPAPRTGCGCGTASPEEEANQALKGIVAGKEHSGNMNVDLLPSEGLT